MATALPCPTSDESAAPTLAPTLRTDTLAGSVLMLLGLTVIQRLVGFGRSVLFCRWLEPEQLGQWDMAQSFLVLASAVAVLAVPGVFGRYVEHYRQRGQLRTLLRGTALACSGLGAIAVVTIYFGRRWFSTLIFGMPDQAEVVAMLASALAALLVFNFLAELFTALRLVRVVAFMQLANGLLFAILGTSLLFGWQCSAASVVVAYGAAGLLTAAVAVWWLVPVWIHQPVPRTPLAQRALWTKIVPFAGWVLSGAVLANLFTIVDRYMIVHFSGMPVDEALSQVGIYHSSRIVPMLMVSIALMLGTMITPHLSHDWEAGRRRHVAVRLRLFLKLLTFGLTAAAAMVLLAAPLLFDVAFQGKFEGGREVLPWTLTYCIWFGLIMVSENFLWCAEKARLGSIALGVGLAANVGLNLLLLPPLGLLGAVLATTLANLVALGLVCAFNHRLGMRIDRGLWVVLSLPLALPLGATATLLALAAVALGAFRGTQLLSAEERHELTEGTAFYLQRFRRQAHALASEESAAC